MCQGGQLQCDCSPREELPTPQFVFCAAWAGARCRVTRWGLWKTTRELKEKDPDSVFGVGDLPEGVVYSVDWLREVSEGLLFKARVGSWDEGEVFPV